MSEKKSIRILLAMAVLSAFIVEGKGLDEQIGKADEMTVEAEHAEASVETGKVTLKGNVKVGYGNLSMKAGEAWIDQTSHDFEAKDQVEITTADQSSTWKSPHIRGNFEKREFFFDAFKFDGAIWHSQGQGGSNSQDGRQSLTDSWMTTCDLDTPHYCLWASEIKHYPDNRFTAKHLVLKFGSVPVFYFPYVTGTTDDRTGLIFHPGYSSKRGAYLQLGRLWRLGQGTEDEARLFADFMTKRGIGLGAKVQRRSSVDEIAVNAYGLLDQDPPETEHGYNRRFKVHEDRFRIHSYYARQLTGHLAFRGNVDWLSDIDMLEDWFKHDYDTMTQPKSYLSLQYDGSWYHAGIQARARLNDFYTVVEKLPEGSFVIPRTRLWESIPLEYQGAMTAGYYSVKWRDFDRSRQEMLGGLYDPSVHQDPRDYGSFRGDTTHFLYVPLAVRDWLTFTPRAGFKATYYSKSSKKAISSEGWANMMDVDNPERVRSTAPVPEVDDEGGEVFRIAFEVGAELKSMAYSDWMDFQWKKASLDGLQHVLEPYVNYTYAPEPSHDRKYLYFFDENDRLELQHFIRLGLDQSLYSHQNGALRRILRWQNYIDFHFERGEDWSIESMGDDRGHHGGDFGSRLDIMPTPWLNFWAMLLHDMGEGVIQRGEAGFLFGEPTGIQLGIQYVYRNDHYSRSTWSMGSTLADLTGESSYYKKYYECSDSISCNFSVPINSKMRFNANWSYDCDKSHLSSHTYTINRDLHCWEMAFGVGWSNNDFMTMVLFRLKAFPKIKMNLSMNP